VVLSNSGTLFEDTRHFEQTLDFNGSVAITSLLRGDRDHGWLADSRSTLTARQ